jgi:predicted  nucleic acid-binding Zn-ribbon protein
MTRKGRGGGLHGYDEPTITETSGEEVVPPEERDIPLDRHNQPSEVFERIGILPFVNRGYEIYELMSLYFLMPHDFLHFLNWSKAPEVIDITFGIYLTNVLNAIEDWRDDEADISDEMAESPSQIEHLEKKLDDAQDRVTKLQQQRKQLETQIASKTDRLESLKQGSNAEERLNELRSRIGVLQSKRADLKTQRSERVSELAETERKIQRYEDSELVDDIGDIGEELRSLMTVPDRCPVCTNTVDGTQRERLLRDQQCPLCDKDVDDELIRVEKEHQPDGSLFDRREEQREELEELETQRDDLEYDIKQLEQRIQSTEDEIEEVKEDIEDQDFEDVIQQRETIEQEVRELREEAASTEVDIESTENEIERLAYELWANRHLADLLEERKELDNALETLHGIVYRVRKDQRRELKARLREEMEDKILPKFERGTFAEARGVSFDSENNYHFTLHSPTQKFKSTRAERETAEATLHSLLFHSAVLNLLTEESNAPPIRMLTIDSPMTNDMDENNRYDVTNLLTSLPEYLNEYQIIVSMAESDSSLMKKLEQSHIPMKEFNKAEENDFGEAESMSRGKDEENSAGGGVAS